MNEAEYLAGLLNNTRVLAYFYLDKLNNADWFEQFEIQGNRVNSVAWNLAHMAWAQNFFVLVATGNTAVNIRWLDLFKIGSDPVPQALYPSRQDILSAFENIHTLALHQVRTMRKEQFDEPNFIDLKFKNGQSQRLAIHHHLRHEGTHIGHLAMLAKMHGIHTI
jgi:hypothetical protein